MRITSLRRVVCASIMSVLLATGCSQASASKTMCEGGNQPASTETSKRSDSGSPLSTRYGEPKRIFALIDGFFTCPDFIATANTIQGTNIAAVLSKVIFVVGYSYGGWTSIKLVSELGESTNLMRLVTIDPISIGELHDHWIFKHFLWRTAESRLHRISVRFQC